MAVPGLNCFHVCQSVFLRDGKGRNASLLPKMKRPTTCFPGAKRNMKAALKRDTVLTMELTQ